MSKANDELVLVDTHDGVTTQFDGDLFHFCGDECHPTFQERYTGLANQA